MIKKTIGSKIKEYREINDLSRKDLALKIGVSASALANYENGYREPSVEILINLARELDVSIDTLCGIKQNVRERFLFMKEIEYYKEKIKELQDERNNFLDLIDKTYLFINQYKDIKEAIEKEEVTKEKLTKLVYELHRILNKLYKAIEVQDHKLNNLNSNMNDIENNTSNL